MFILKANLCENASILATILFVKKLVKITSIIIPILLVLLLTIDIAKAVMASDDNQIKTAQKLAIKRIIYALLIFFVPIIVDASLSTLGKKSIAGLECYYEASNENIDKLVKNQQVKDKKYQSDINDAIEKSKQNKQAEQEKQKLLREKAKERAAEKSFSNNGNPGSGSICTNCSSNEKIAQTAELLAWPLGTPKNVFTHHYYYNRAWTSWSELTEAKPTKAFMDAYDKVKPNHFKAPLNKKWGTKHSRIGASCDKFVGTVVRYSGYDTSFPDSLGSNLNKRLSNTAKWKKVSGKDAKRGSVCIIKSGTHILIYLGDGKVAHAGYGLYKNHGRFGRIENTKVSNYNCYIPIA